MEEEEEGEKTWYDSFSEIGKSMFGNTKVTISPVLLRQIRIV